MNISLIILFLILITFNAFGQVSVEVTPARTNEILTLYPFEVETYLINITNFSEVQEENIKLKVSVDNSLAILEGFKEVKEKGITIKSIPAKEKKVIELKIKALPSALKKEENWIQVEYGINKLTNYTGTYIKGNNAPILVDFIPEKTSVNPAEENSLLLNVKNISDKKLTEINVLLISDDNIKLSEKNFSLPDLMPQEEFKNKKISILIPAEMKGEKTITIAMTFVDENGLHEIQKKATISIQNKKIVLYLLIAVIVVLIIISIFFKIKKPKEKEIMPLEEPEMQEINQA